MFRDSSGRLLKASAGHLRESRESRAARQHDNARNYILTSRNYLLFHTAKDFHIMRA
jgi:hypothetical protein